MSAKKLRTLITFLLVIAVGALFSITTTTFFTTSNLSQLLRDGAYLGTIALGMAFVMISGNIDLSAGGIVCFSGCIGAKFAMMGLPMPVVVLVTILVGIALGYLNSVLVNHLHLAPFVATLSSGFIYSGLGLIFTYRENGRIISKAVGNPGFTAIGGKIGMFYYSVIAWIILAALAYFVLTRTKFGTHTYAMGSHETAAKMSGVKLFRTKATCYMICGALCGVAAAFTVAYTKTATPSLGTSMEFQAIAACVVGGIVMSGGSGSAIGAFLGGLFMAMLNNGMLKYGLSTDWQQIFQGAIIILATGFDAQFTRIMNARMRAKNE